MSGSRLGNWATADGQAVTAILHDLLKAVDHVAYQKLIDAGALALPRETAEAAAA